MDYLDDEVDVDAFYLAKRALQTTHQKTLPRREPQIQELYQFIEKHLASKSSGSMYISGAPGTGKTAVVRHVLEKLANPDDFEDGSKLEAYRFVPVFINCMSLHKPMAVFEDISKQLKVRLNSEMSVKDGLARRIVSKAGRPIVLVLDEMDQLLGRASKELLFTLFEWTRLEGSRLVLIGIANALDLAVRHLPKFSSPSRLTPSPSRPTSSPSRTALRDAALPGHKCHSICFPPYEIEDIAYVLEDRLRRSSKTGNQVFDPAAIKFVALKVAASTGDMRKALSACKQALQSAENINPRTPTKRLAESDRSERVSPCTPKKQPKVADKITVAAVAKLLAPQKMEDLPLQQAVILATLLRIHRKAPNTKKFSIDGVHSPVPLDTIYAEHHKICQIGCFSRIESSDLPSYLSQLQDRSLLTIVENSSSPSRKKAFGRTNKTAGVIFDPKTAEMTLRNDTHLKAVIDCGDN